MKRILFLILLAGMSLFSSCSRYSEKFVEKYLNYEDYKGGTAIIVYPKDDGFCSFITMKSVRYSIPNTARIILTINLS